MRTRRVDRRDARDLLEPRHRRASWHLAGVLCATALVTSPLATAAAPSLDLMGTWYVLIHYRDEATGAPDADRFGWEKGTSCAAFDCEPAFEAIPTVSEWGLVIMTLLLLTGAKIYFGRRRLVTA